MSLSFHHPDRKSLGVVQEMVGRAVAEDLFDPRDPLPSHGDGIVMPASGLFEDISGNIVIMTITSPPRGSCRTQTVQRLARLLQDRTL